MKKNIRRFLALFLAFAMLAAYSFSPQNLTAFAVSAAEEPTVTAQEAEQKAEPTKSTQPSTKAEAENKTQAETQATPAEQETEAVTEEGGGKSTEPTEATEETKPTEDEQKEAEEYPAKTFKGKAGGVHVEVKAPEGAFPKGTEMEVKAVGHSAELDAQISKAVGDEVEDYKAVDITFHKDGKEIQPEIEVQVYLNASGLDAEAEKEVVHVNDSGSASVVGEASADGAASVPATHFSTYAIAAKAADGEKAGEDNKITVTFDPTTDPADPLAPETIEVVEGETIGNQLPDVPEVPGYNTKWVKEGTTTEVTANTVVTEPFTAVVAQEKIEYTVTFVQENGSEETRTASIDNGFAINDLPEVTPKTNKIGKWVYPGTTNEFTVGTVVTSNLTVNAYYEQNIFTVKFMVDNAIYEQMTTATGTTIVLPSDPIKSGATFKGWFTEPGGQGTQYTATSTVNEDLTLYAYFEGQVTVRFLVKDDNGNVISEKSQYFVDLTVGDHITTLPDDPFVEGKVFDYWKNATTGDEVEVGTVVTKSFDAIAVFKTIDTYELKVNYFYKNDANQKVEVGSQVYDIVEGDFPYTVTAPGYTIATEVTGKPTYYPSRPTINVDKDDFTYNQESKKYERTEECEYVAADAHYKVGHYLEKLNGSGYDLIETVDKVGVKNSKVTPDINSYAFAEYKNRDENVTITGNASQELKVYYDRREFTLSYNVGGGEYIEAVTAPYETEITLPTTANRAGYTFAGWYKDADCTQSAGSSITLETNTTLYAKWTPAQVTYQIVYLVENADDEDYSYLATKTKKAETGSTITMNAQTAGAADTRPDDLDTTNFTFKDSTTETVKADGTTVVTVRYSRNVYTLVSQSSYYNASVTAKYGADITQAWTEQFNRHAGSWSYNNENNSKFKSLTRMPSLSVRTNSSPANTIYVYHHADSANYYQHLEYWLQNYEDGDATTTYNGKTYGRVKSVDMRYNYLSNVDDWYEISGYSKAGYTAQHRKNQNTGTWQNFTYTWNRQFSQYGNQYTYTRFNFYYDAEEYPLTFWNYDGSLISTQFVTLGDDISNYLTSNVPTAPMEGATWKGWYTDSEHTTGNEYSGGTKMPAGLVLYGDFEFPERTVTFDSQGGSGVDPQTDEYGFYADMPDNPIKDHYAFQGWFTAADETGSPYDWNQPVTEDITLYAHWTQETISYTVHYYEQGTTTKIMEDKVVSDPSFTEGQEITENAPTVAGHVSDKASQSIELSFDEENNTIIFYYYTIPDELTYTVNYVLKDHPEIKVAESKTVTVPGTTTNAMEMAVEVDTNYLATQTSDADILGKHYKPIETTKEKQLGLEENVITFEYIPYTTTTITVNYLDMDGNAIHDSDTAYVEKGDTFTVQNKAPDGFVYHHAFLDGTTTAPQATYQITGNEGNLVINIYYQKKLIIIANNKSKTYDGTALSSSFANPSDYTVTGNMRGDTLKSVEFEGSQTNAGTSATTPKNAQIAKGPHAITNPEEYYSIIYVPGSLTVKPVSVYISISADQWNAHSGSTGGPNYYTGQTFNVGFTNTNKQHFNDDPAKSAYINITSGQRNLFKEKYGNAIWNVLYKNDGALISEKDAGLYTVTGEQQRATVAGVRVDGQLMMSDPNYSITLYARDSFLKIVPLPLEITTPSDSKAYDGTALEKSEGATLDHSYWTSNVGGEWTAATTAVPGEVTLGTGETITFNITGTQTEVGSSENSYAIEWGNINSSNYTIKETLGSLEITENTKAIVISSATNSWTYDGETHTDEVYTVTYDGTKVEADESGIVFTLPTGDAVTITPTADGVKNVTDTADKNNTFEYELTNAERYSNVSATYGTLSITPRSVTLTSGSATKEYDGTALTNDEVTVGGDRFITGEGATYNVTGSQTEVGGEEGNNTFTYTLNEGTKAGNYEIETVNGTLTVTKSAKPLKITSGSNSWMYDGEDHSEPVYTITYGEGEGAESGTATKGEDGTYSYKLSTGDTITISDVRTVKNVSETAANNNTFSYVLENADQYENVSATYGTLTITKRSVTLTSATDTKVYDGKPLTNKNVTVDGDGFAEGEGATYDVTGSQTEVGGEANNNAFTYTLNEGTLAGNYDITPVYGTLTVTKTEKVITITSGTHSWMYDGKNHSEPVYTITYGEGEDAESGTATKSEDGTYSYKLSTGDTITISDVKAVKDVSETAANNNTFSYELTHATYYETVTPVYGTLTITKRSVTLTSGSATKEYDGTALTNDEVTVDGDGFAEGEGAAYKVTGSQTEVGGEENNNTFTYTLNEGTLAGNYDITPVYGTLTVTRNTTLITITSKDNAWKYDGTKHSNPDYVVKYGDKELEPDGGHGLTYTLPTGDTITISNPATVKNVADTAEKNNTFSYELTNAERYSNVSATYGTLSITKRSVTLTSGSATKEYDGTPLTNKNVTVGGDGFITGEGATYDVTGSQTEVGGEEGNNTFTYTLNEGTLAGNYDITPEYGTLTVTKNTKAITIESSTKSWTYDGETHTDEVYTVKYGGEAVTADESGKVFTLTTGDKVTITPTAAGVKDVADTAANNNTYTYVLENAGQYANVSATYGTLSIMKATMSISAIGFSEVYDTKEHKGGAVLSPSEGSSADVITGTTILYSVKDGDNWSEWTTDVPAITNVGSITYKAKAVNPNFNDAVSGEATIAITPKAVTVTAENKSKTYKDPDPYLTATVDGTFGSDTVQYNLSRENGENVGIYAIDVTGDTLQGNYEITFISGTLTITKAKAFAITAVNFTGTYDGATHEGGYTGDVPEETKISYSIDGGKTWSETVPSITNAGTVSYKVKAENSNYEDAFAEGTLTINPATVTVQADNKTKAYGAQDPVWTATVTGMVNGENADVIRAAADGVKDVQVRVKFSRERGENPGTYRINVTGDAVQGNYNVKYIPGTLTILEPDPTPTPTPAPGGGNNPGGGNPGVVAAAPAPAPAAPAVITDNPAPTTITDDTPPKATTAYWALINLICAILTALLSLIMLIRYFGKRREEDEETGEVTEIKRRGGVKLASIIPAIGAIIAFILTEDMSLPMQMVDKWTLLMVVILAIQVLIAFFSRKKEEDEENDEGAMA